MTDTERRDLLTVYQEIWTNVRETDQISLKLLAFVPTVSTLAAGWLTFLARQGATNELAIIAIAAISALLTLAIYLWERRNIQTCEWLRDRLGTIEEQWPVILASRPAVPKFAFWKVGKRDAERIIYMAAIAVWFVPIVLAQTSLSDTRGPRVAAAPVSATNDAAAISASDLLAAVAILVSIGAIVITFWLARRQEAVGIRPVLIFVYDGSIGWKLQNVGSGPALNVLVAQKKSEHWFNPVRVPPVAAGSEMVLKWLRHVNTTSLGVSYVDFKDRPYTSTCKNDLSTTKSGQSFPRWEERDIKRHWDDPPYME